MQVISRYSTLQHMKYDLNDLHASSTLSHHYNLEGMSCQGCATQVQTHLSQLSQIKDVKVDKVTDTVQLTLSDDLSLSQLNASLQSLDSKYHASLIQDTIQNNVSIDANKRSWLATYKPILLIFSFLIIVTGTIQYQFGEFQMMAWMRHFMAGFFLVFSFFKFLNLKGFAKSYQMYDLVAARLPLWGYIYPFIELGLGLAYLTGFNPQVTNATALIVMSVSIIGVLRSVLNRKKIQCACLGDVFNLPMSTVTVIEDGLMILMSGWMLIQHL